MATQKQDVELGVAVNVTNADRIDALTADLKQLADQGALTADDFERLTGELKQLGAQSEAAAGLNKIEAELTQTNAALTEARAKVDQLSTALAEQKGKVESAASAQQTAAETLRTTQNALIDAKEKLGQLNLEYDRAGKATVGYAQKATPLKEAIVELTAAQSRQKLELRDANAALTEAQSDLKKAETAYRTTAKAVGELSAAAELQSQELNAATEGLLALGVAATSAANAEGEVAKALDTTTKELTEAEKQYQKLLPIQKAVAEANEYAVELAKAAAASYADAARKRTQADQEAAQAAEAAALRQKLAAEEVAAAEKALAEAAAQAKQKLTEAFSATGTRSVAAIREEIDNIRASLVTLQQQGVSKLELDKAFAGAKIRINELNDELGRVPGSINIVASGVELLKNQFFQLAAAYQAIDLVGKFIEAQVQIEGLRRALTLSSGSVQEAARQIQFLRDAASLTGQSFSQLTDDYKRFSVALSTSGYTAQQTEQLFLAVASAAGKLGLSTDKVNNILNALGQIANKGTVSMEELRGQLGESLPGALKIAADAMQVPVDKLVKLIETGQVLSRDLLPYLPEAFAKAFGPATDKVQGFQAEWNRLKNVITETMQQAADGAGFKALTNTIGFVAENFRQLSKAVVGVGEAFGAIKILEYLARLNDISVATAKTTAEQVANTTATVANSAAKVNAAKVETELAAAETAAAAATRGATAATVANTAAQTANAAASGTSSLAMRSLAGAVGGAGTASTGLLSTVTGFIGRAGAWGAAIYLLVGAFKDVGTAIGEGIAKMQGLDKELEKIKQRNAVQIAAINEYWAKFRETIVKVQVAYQDVNKQNAESIIAAEKAAKAREVEGQALLALSKLFGDVTRERETELDVAYKNLKASIDVAAARKKEADTLAEYAAGLERAAASTGDNTAKTRELIQEAKNHALVAKEEAERAAAQAEATKTATAALEAQAETLKDNSGRLDELRIGYENAASRAQIMNQLRKEGVVSSEAAANATRDEAKAYLLYKDALADTSRNLQLKIDKIKTDYETTRAGLSVREAEQQASEKLAKSYGNEAEAIQAQINQKNLQIDAIRAKTKATVDEANATITKLQKDREEIKGTDDISEAKRREIDLRIQNEQNKIKETQAGEANIRVLQREKDLLYSRGATVIGASNDAISALERENAEREKVNATIEKSIALENQRRNVDANGFSLDKTGKQTVNAQADTYISILSQLKGYGLTDSEASDIAREFVDSNGNVPFFNNPGQLKYGGPNGGTLSYALNQAASKAIFNRAGQITPAPKPSSTPATTPTAAPAPNGGNQTYTVNLNLGGSNTPINVASDADAKKLIAFMSALQSRTA